MKTPYLFLAVILLSLKSLCYSQIKNNNFTARPVEKTINLEMQCAQLINFQPTENSNHKIERREIVMRCPPGIARACYRSNPTYYRFVAAPRRDISNIVLMVGGVVESPAGKYSINGSRSEPLFFMDGVKTRFSKEFPTAAIGEVEVLKAGIPANIGDTDSGAIFISSISVSQ